MWQFLSPKSAGVLMIHTKHCRGGLIVCIDLQWRLERVDPASVLQFRITDLIVHEREKSYANLLNFLKFDDSEVLRSILCGAINTREITHRALAQ
jgi:hypothetical protein